ncbi:phosphonate metabolism protein/1,5-bisphosphokinase (PRPP-forming) PhnN [Rhodosalinus halophilus]|uniref:Ribose 1,5-bisphosphate phosphokinase PhnN n=1 Tax=Rhodosalinus halophilus TaxID=2259333 RepID=A0A365UAC9_9RHOB|nr:phosphonate metabolism protein/1,5-bisphosphokinase (PRPP-forming) PhnN [Rhodosalinus halophilus]RBI85914.1 phosphonate metabolism protein/1,5-bisphosphokinase (PRPP-forming) PhnN [Rhodosalinus halophilus]
MSGRVIAVVGPSGVGKDTVMAAMAARMPELHLVRRVVTRPASGTEPFEAVSDADFARREAGGAFALSWRAHGLSYGLPWTELAALEEGRDALANLSRRALLPAQARFAGLRVLALEAPAEVLARRLAGRGRETAGQIAARLAREAPLPEGLDVARIENSGTVAEAAEAALAALYPERALS